MSDALSLIGFLGFIACLIWLIVSAIKKQKKKNSLIGMAIAFVLFVVGIATMPSQSTSNSSQNVSTSMASESSSASSVIPNAKTISSQQVGKFNEDDAVSKLAVTKYQYTDSIKTHWIILTIKNNSNFNLNITVNLDLFDKSGKIIGTKDANQEAFEKGSEIALTFSNDDAPASVKYQISAEQEAMYDCVISELSQKTVLGKEKAIVSVTNNGSQGAEFVEGTGLFFKGKTLVGFSTAYFMDNDDEIKAGKTIKKELACYDTFDSVKVYLTGRR